MAGARGWRSIEIASDALALLMGHDWPGNVREFENVLKFAVVTSRGACIRPGHLPAPLAHGRPLSLLQPPRQRLLNRLLGGTGGPTGDRRSGSRTKSGGLSLAGIPVAPS